MRRRRVIVGLAVLALAAGTAIVLWPRGPLPSRATFKQVREGMTFEEVCAAVGGPPGDYTGGTRRGPDDLFGLRPYWLGGDPPRGEPWIGDDGMLVVTFDPAGRLACAEVWEVYPASPPPFWSRLLARLGL
jgi:hypothetical protein